MIIDPKEPIFEVWSDADFCGLWDKTIAADDPVTARSRTGHIITFAKCPVVWNSSLQSVHSFSSTESEYISLSTASRETIPLMDLLVEFNPKICRKMPDV